MNASRDWLRRWGGYVVFVVVFAIACAGLSIWQWERRAEAVAEIDRVARNWDAAPRPVDAVLPELDSWSTDDRWTPVTMTGRYLMDEQLLVRNRPAAAGPGVDVLVPFQQNDGTVVVVDRGWLPVGRNGGTPDSVPDPPSGEVTVVGRLKPGEPTLPGRTAPPGQIPSIDLPIIADEVDAPTYTGAYVALAKEDPAPPTRPQVAERPDDDEGPHLSYALQWIAFGILAFIGLGWAIRRDRLVAREQAAAAAGHPAPPRRPSRRDVDADAEDSLLDRV